MVENPRSGKLSNVFREMDFVSPERYETAIIQIEKFIDRDTSGITSFPIFLENLREIVQNIRTILLADGIRVIAPTRSGPEEQLQIIRKVRESFRIELMYGQREGFMKTFLADLVEGKWVFRRLPLLRINFPSRAVFDDYQQGKDFLTDIVSMDRSKRVMVSVIITPESKARYLKEYCENLRNILGVLLTVLHPPQVYPRDE